MRLFFFILNSSANSVIGDPVPDSINSINAQETVENDLPSVTTKALVTSSRKLSYSDTQAKGSRYPRHSSNTNRVQSDLPPVSEDPIDEETNDVLSPLNSELNSFGIQNVPRCEDKNLNSCEDKNSTSCQNDEQKQQDTVCPAVMTEDDIKSIKSGKSEVFYDAQEDFSSITSVENNDADSKSLLRKCARDESNFGDSFYGGTEKLSSANGYDNLRQKDNIDAASKKKSTRVSFSQATRRWSQLRSVRKVSNSFTRASKRQSNSTHQNEGEVELRKKR